MRQVMLGALVVGSVSINFACGERGPSQRKELVVVESSEGSVSHGPTSASDDAASANKERKEPADGGSGGDEPGRDGTEDTFSSKPSPEAGGGEDAQPRPGEHEASLRTLLGSSRGRIFSLVLLDERGRALARPSIFPNSVAAAKVCLDAGEAVAVNEARWFRSCCDHTGTSFEDAKPRQVGECWVLGPIACKNLMYRFEMSFLDGDTLQYNNADTL